MNTPARMLQVVLAATVLVSCGGQRSSSGTSPRSDANLITAEELGSTVSITLYDAVRRLRPTWMTRGQPTAVHQEYGEVVVYVDGTRFGTFESLRQLTPHGIASVRYHSPGSAAGKFGPGHLLGAIEIITIGL